MVAALITALCLVVVFSATFVALKERMDERNSKLLRDMELVRVTERQAMEERYLGIIRELSRLVKSANAVEAVKADHAEHLNKLEKEAVTNWYKEKLVPKEDTTSIPKTLKTPEGHELQLLEIM